MVETDRSIASKQVEGSPIYGRSGERLGTIDHLMFDKASGRYYAVVRLGTLLGISERYYPVPWTALAYDTRLGGFIADIDPSRLFMAPRHAKRSSPEPSDQTYFRRVDEFWGSPR
jgi:PRC-barrel domain